jgi:hypothetical protein
VKQSPFFCSLIGTALLSFGAQQTGADSCFFTDGEFCTYPQAAWGDNASAAGQLLSSNFLGIYPSGIVEAGIPGAAAFSMHFTQLLFIFIYLPAAGAPAPLNADYVNPSSTSSGTFGREVQTQGGSASLVGNGGSGISCCGFFGGHLI